MPGEREHCIVVAGGDAPDRRDVGRARLTDGRVRDRGRLGRRPRARGRPPRRCRDRRLRLRVDRRSGRGHRGRRAGRTSPRRQGPHRPRAGAGRSARRRRGRRRSSSAATAVGATTCSPTSSCSARPATATCRIAAYLGRSRVHVLHGGPAVRASTASIGELVSLLPVHGPADGVRTQRPALSAARRDPSGRHDTGREQRGRVTAGRGAARRGHVGRRASRANVMEAEA